MKKYSLLVLLVLVTLVSCKKHTDKALWDIKALAPLVQTSLTINNIIKDTSSIKKATDNSLSVVIREQVANVTSSNLVALAVTPYYKKVKLSSLVLNDQTSVQQITLGQLARALIASGTPSNIFIGNFILSSQGNTVPVPPINNLSSNNLPLNIQQFFDDATFIAGDMDITLENNLPLDVTNIHFNVKNKVAGTTVADQTFTNLLVGTSQTQSVNLAGMTVEGNLLLNLLNLDLGGGTVVIDTNAALKITITIKNVSLQSATAVFPAQTVLDDTENIELTGAGGIQLYEAIIASGNVQTQISSTVNSDILLTYSIPGATKNGVAFSTNRTVKASTNGHPRDTTFLDNFVDYQMNLRGPNNDTVNTFSNRLIAKTVYTGQKVFITKDDSVEVTVNLVNAIPSYVKGYLGRDTIHVGPSTTSLTIFNKIESGTLNFQNAKLNMVIENGLGVNGSVKINNVVATNTKTGASQTLTGPNIGNNVTINPATDNPLTIAIDTIDLGTGSNAVSLLNILPNQILYDVQVVANPLGNTLTYTDFAYSTSGLKAYLDIEMPLSFLSSDLVLSDTANFNSASLQQKSVNSGTFTVNVDNGFPLEASLKMYLLDQTGGILDSLTSPSILQAAPIGANGRVSQKSKSQIAYEVDDLKMGNIYHASKVIFKIKFSTEPVSTYLKIYSDYSIDFKLVGNVDYTVHKK
jgi:hypothetical protein